VKRKFVIGVPPAADAPQRQPTPQQIDAAQRILSHDHQRTYGEGAKGATIRALQIYLASKGYNPGRFDGDWGAKTQAAFASYNKDRNQSFPRATPEALAQMSKEAGQPLPRQRPAQPSDMPPAAPITMTSSAQGMAGDQGAADVRADLAPKAPPFLPSVNAPHAAERGYDPNISSMAADARAGRYQPTDDMAGYHEPVGISPHPTQFGPDLAALGAMQPAQPPPAPPSIPFANRARFDAASEPVTSDVGVPDQLIESMAARRQGSGNPLRDALINGGGATMQQRARATDALREALIAQMVMGQ
jgi:hypothetical protein